MSEEHSDNDDERMSLSHHENSGGGDDNVNSENEETAARRIDPSASRKNIVRKSVPKLDPARLKGPKGVATIEKYFEDFKFHGKGHEKSDLNRIMKRLEHWAHRLFPKYQFDDFLERVETLGSRKELQSYLTKYRRDMLTDDRIIEEDDENCEGEGEKSPEPVDEFDLLIAEQIEKTKQATQNKDHSIINDKKGEERNRNIALERKEANAQRLSAPSTDSFHDISEESEKTIVNSQQLQIKDSDENKESEEEIKKRIERNRQIAMERKMARMRQREMENSKNQEKLSQIHEAVLPLREDNPEKTGSESINEEEMEVKSNSVEENNISPSEDSLATQKVNRVYDKNDNKSSKRLLTNEELDKEIGAAVEMFMKKKR